MVSTSKPTFKFKKNKLCCGAYISKDSGSDLKLTKFEIYQIKRCWRWEMEKMEETSKSTSVNPVKVWNTAVNDMNALNLYCLGAV